MPTDPSFRTTIEDVFAIRGRGTVATGRVAQGTLRVGDAVQLERPDLAKTVAVSSNF